MKKTHSITVLALGLAAACAGLPAAYAADLVISDPTATTVGIVTGGDVGEGLDLEGDFIYALSIGAEPDFEARIRDATFKGLIETEVPGTTFVAGNRILNWYPVDYGDSANDDLLEVATSSIRWSNAADANVPEMILTLENMQLGTQYKFQMMFGEQCCNRGFDVFFDDQLIIKDFNPGIVHEGIGNRTQEALITHVYVPKASTVVVRFDGREASSDFPDHNAILNAVTVEKLGALVDTDKDGMPDDWETSMGFNPNDASDASKDFDGDGVSNLEEFKAGSNPTDTIKPTIVSAATTSDFKTITITFSEEVDPATATAAANYTISPALAVSSVSYKKKVATLTTAQQAPGGTAYTIAVKGIKDTSKNEVAADTKAVAYSYVMTKAGLLRFAWWAVDTALFPDDEAGSLNGASPIETLLDHPRYLENKPNQVLALSSFNSRDAFPTDAKENYGATIEGLITPTENGDYRFFIHSDDSSRLWLSTDDKEANLAQIAEETGCCGNFAEPGVTKTSEPITLVANRSYFIRLAYKEGGGGDYGRVAWRKEGDATPAASLVPIPGKFLASAVDLPVHPDGTFGTISPAARSRTAGPLPVITIVHADGKTPWTAANVSLKFDGASVAPTFVKESGTATIRYTPSAVLPARSVHTVALTYPDPGGNPTVLEWSFEVANYTTLSTAIGTKPGSGKDAGFRIRTVQKETGRGNTDADGERQLRDNFGEADIAEAGPNAGYFHHADVINFNQDAPGAVGNFNADNGFEDQPVYGISGNTDNFTQEILTYLDLPAGVITMGVNSDDGFNVKPVTQADPAVAPLGIFNGGRGASDTTFSFVVPVAGVYPMRMIWYEGGGGANAEWFTVSATGAKLPINSSAAGAVKAFRGRDETQKLPSEGGKLSIARDGANLRITFTGRLQSATSVTGPYTDVAGATSPHPVTPTDTARFYRSAE